MVGLCDICGEQIDSRDNAADVCEICGRYFCGFCGSIEEGMCSVCKDRLDRDATEKPPSPNKEAV